MINRRYKILYLISSKLNDKDTKITKSSPSPYELKESVDCVYKISMGIKNTRISLIGNKLFISFYDLPKNMEENQIVSICHEKTIEYVLTDDELNVLVNDLETILEEERAEIEDLFLKINNY